MSETTIAQAITKLEADSVADAMKLIRPLVTDSDWRGEALFVLGRCYEQSESFATASYLLAEAVRVTPELQEAAEHLEFCKKKVEERGLAEDFTDSGHTNCPSCELHYRAEYPICPYCCEVDVDNPPVFESVPEPEEEPDLMPWEDDTAMAKLQRAGSEIVDKVKELAESESVKEVTQKAQELGREAAKKAKELAENERVKEVSDHARKTGGEVLDKTREFIETEKVKFEEGDESEKRMILIKWAAMVIGAWLILYVISLIF